MTGEVDGSAHLELRRKLHLDVADKPFMAQEGIPAVRTTVSASRDVLFVAKTLSHMSPLSTPLTNFC